MKTLIVTRHSGAAKWLSQKGFNGEIRESLDRGMISQLEPGDRVVGVLPITLAMQVLGKDAEVYIIQFPPHQGPRGVELSAEEMENQGAKLFRFGIQEYCCGVSNGAPGRWAFVRGDTIYGCTMCVGGEYRAKLALVDVDNLRSVNSVYEGGVRKVVSVT